MSTQCGQMDVPHSSSLDICGIMLLGNANPRTIFQIVLILNEVGSRSIWLRMILHLGFCVNINPKQGMQYTCAMVARWFGPILGQGTTKECMMVLELFLNRKSERNNLIWMEGDFNALLMCCHFVKRNKWKNILHTLMQGDNLPASSIWLNLMTWT